jgi:hypothetical protein
MILYQMIMNKMSLQPNLHKQLYNTHIKFLESLNRYYPENKALTHQINLFDSISRKQPDGAWMFNLMDKGILEEAHRMSESNATMPQHDNVRAVVLKKVMTLDTETCSNIRWLHNIEFIKMYTNVHFKIDTHRSQEYRNKRSMKIQQGFAQKLRDVCKAFAVISACGDNLNKFMSVAQKVVQDSGNVNINNIKSANGIHDMMLLLGQGLHECEPELKDLADRVGEHENEVMDMLGLLMSEDGKDVDIQNVMNGLSQVMPASIIS